MNLFTIKTFLLLIVVAATEPQWMSQPGDILVLEGTKLVLNWTHLIQPPLDITWDYKGTESRPVLDLIMDYTTGAGVYIPIQDKWYGRVAYDQSINGSAIMTLDNVTSVDERYYEVNVRNLDDQRYSLVGQTSVSVVSRTNIKTTVTINEKSFELSLLGNGTQVILPDYDENTSSIQVMVHVNGTAPKPRNISIQIRERTLLLTEYSCRSSYRCETYMYVHMDLPKKLDLRITVSFNVQNLPPIGFTQVIRTDRFSAPEPVIQSGDVRVQGTKLVLNRTHRKVDWTNTSVDILDTSSSEPTVKTSRMCMLGSVIGGLMAGFTAGYYIGRWKKQEKADEESARIEARTGGHENGSTEEKNPCIATADAAAFA